MCVCVHNFILKLRYFGRVSQHSDSQVSGYFSQKSSQVAFNLYHPVNDRPSVFPEQGQGHKISGNQREIVRRNKSKQPLANDHQTHAGIPSKLATRNLLQRKSPRGSTPQFHHSTLLSCPSSSRCCWSWTLAGGQLSKRSSRTRTFRLASQMPQSKLQLRTLLPLLQGTWTLFGYLGSCHSFRANFQHPSTLSASQGLRSDEGPRRIVRFLALDARKNMACMTKRFNSYV